MPDVTEPAETHHKNMDVHCLRCGAYNIAENHICGRCGASLPLVYDEEGKVFSLRQRSLDRGRLVRKKTDRVSTVRWAMRMAVVVVALYIAYLILRGHH